MKSKLTALAVMLTAAGLLAEKTTYTKGAKA